MKSFIPANMYFILLWFLLSFILWLAQWKRVRSG